MPLVILHGLSKQTWEMRIDALVCQPFLGRLNFVFVSDLLPAWLECRFRGRCQLSLSRQRRGD